MAFEKIIVLDDEMIIRKTLQEQLRKRKYLVAAASTIAEAQALMQKDNFDLILADIHLPDGEGTELIEPLSMSQDGPMIMMMTGDGSIESAVKCIREGAFDYIIKPFDIDQIDVAIKRAESYSHLVKVNRYFSQQRDNKGSLVGKSDCMEKLHDMLKKVATTEATVLICGENGTGKELIAQELHTRSPRANKPYIKVNCAAMPENLMESEFFGHEKGAFTGATQRREGRFELAHGGTILLDEISEISPHLQGKLLRVLQEKEFERVGGNTTIKVDVRVIATTNRDLLKSVQAGEFREDLYYRLNVFPINVPPLRDRGNDIMLLANEFLKRSAKKNRKKIDGFSSKAIDALISHNWPGNVRELQNTIERAIILADDNQPISEEILGIVASKKSPIKENEETTSLSSLKDMEKNHILKALEEADGKRKKAAEMLDISLKSLTTKLNQYKKEDENVA